MSIDLPHDLPGILQYQLQSGETRYALPRTPVETLGTSGRVSAPWVCPTIPIGATAWRLVTEEAWRPLSDLPMAWMPFLQRERGSMMDPRKKPPTEEELAKKRQSFRRYETPIEDEESHQ